MPYLRLPMLLARPDLLTSRMLPHLPLSPYKVCVLKLMLPKSNDCTTKPHNLAVPVEKSLNLLPGRKTTASASTRAKECKHYAEEVSGVKVTACLTTLAALAPLYALMITMFCEPAAQAPSRVRRRPAVQVSTDAVRRAFQGQVSVHMLPPS